MGGDRLPARDHGRHAALRQARRPLWARARAFIERTVAAAGVDLEAGPAWLLVQAEHGTSLGDPEAIADGRPFDAGWVREQTATLAVRGLVAGDAPTAAGHATAERLLGALHEELVELVADWRPGDDPRVNDAVTRLAGELARESPAA